MTSHPDPRVRKALDAHASRDRSCILECIGELVAVVDIATDETRLHDLGVTDRMPVNVEPIDRALRIMLRAAIELYLGRVPLRESDDPIDGVDPKAIEAWAGAAIWEGWERRATSAVESARKA